MGTYNGHTLTEDNDALPEMESERGCSINKLKPRYATTILKPDKPYYRW